MRWLWKDDAVGAVVEFLEGTRVGSRASAAMARARADEDRDGEEVLGQESEEERARPALVCTFPLSFSLVRSKYPFLFCQAVWEGGEGVPQYNPVWLGTGNGHVMGV